MLNEVFVPALLSFLVCAVLMPVGIPFLRKLKFGQMVRDDGPESHLKKAGTPTMGGIMILMAVVLVSLIYAFKRPHIFPVLFLTAGFGVIGFLDDFLKIRRHQSEGLNPIQKLLGQFVVTGVFCWLLMRDPELGTSIEIPFTGGKCIDLGWWFVPFCFVVVLGTDNGTNFTDGLDGLASSVTIVVSLCLAVFGMFIDTDVIPFAAIFAGALMGFLMFNAYPAKVFMGDTGSLAIGGFVAGMALVMKIPLMILLFGIIYLVEVVSVILQVGYFKITHGKRIFRMAPIHHHFEQLGWSETRVVSVFTIITVLFSILSIALY